MRILQQSFIFRKDLARILCMSVEAIRTNERRLGLDTARRDVNQRVVRYDTAIAVQQLSLRGQLPAMAYAEI